MVFPNRKIVENIRREYPVGTRVELIKMHDKQAPPVGMTGTASRHDRDRSRSG